SLLPARPAGTPGSKCLAPFSTLPCDRPRSSTGQGPRCPVSGLSGALGRRGFPFGPRSGPYGISTTRGTQVLDRKPGMGGGGFQSRVPHLFLGAGTSASVHHGHRVGLLFAGTDGAPARFLRGGLDELLRRPPDRAE